jgi:hypothetical protein
MIDGGEDPLFIARRLVILASEDVGLADPARIQVAIAAQQAVHFIGMPEGFYPLAHATLYLATCAEEQQRRPRVLGSDARRAGDAQRSGAAASAQRADGFDEGTRLRARLSLRARRLLDQTRELYPRICAIGITMSPVRTMLRERGDKKITTRG